MRREPGGHWAGQREEGERGRDRRLQRHRGLRERGYEAPCGLRESCALGFCFVGVPFSKTISNLSRKRELLAILDSRDAGSATSSFHLPPPAADRGARLIFPHTPARLFTWAKVDRAVPAAAILTGSEGLWFWFFAPGKRPSTSSSARACEGRAGRELAGAHVRRGLGPALRRAGATSHEPQGSEPPPPRRPGDAAAEGRAQPRAQPV